MKGNSRIIQVKIRKKEKKFKSQIDTHFDFS